MTTVDSCVFLLITVIDKNERFSESEAAVQAV